VQEGSLLIESANRKVVRLSEVPERKSMVARIDISPAFQSVFWWWQELTFFLLV
jgi:hypothetical protein